MSPPKGTGHVAMEDVVPVVNGLLKDNSVVYLCEFDAVAEKVVTMLDRLTTHFCEGNNFYGKTCAMKRSCEFAASNGHFLPLDDKCSRSPWMKKPWRNMLCPYLAIWRALGLEGLSLK